MALNAIVTRNVAGYVKRFRVYGTWKEYDLEECAKVGRLSSTFWDRRITSGSGWTSTGREHDDQHANSSGD